MVPPIVPTPNGLPTYRVFTPKKEENFPSKEISFPKMGATHHTAPSSPPKLLLVITESQQAIMILLSLSLTELNELSKICEFRKEDSFNGLVSKILSSKNTSSTTLKAQKAIQQYNKYSGYVERLRTPITLKFERKIADNVNNLIESAFLKTLSLLKDEETCREYIAILRKYNISNPLKITRVQLDKMALYEETIFENTTSRIRGYSLSNLSLNETRKYLSYQEQIKSAIDNSIGGYLQQHKPEYLSLFKKELRITTILRPQAKKPPVALIGLANKAKKLIEKYQMALIKLKEAFNTPDQNNDKTVRAELDRVKKEVANEVEHSYKNAFINTPSEPEKNAFKALLRVTAELEILDEKIIYYARLGEDSLTVSDRNLVDYLKKTGKFSKTQVEPLAFKKMSLFQWIESYKNEHIRFALLRYVQLIEKDIQASSDPGKKRIGSYKDNRLNAFFFALQAAGFGNGELSMIGAMVAFGKLTADERNELIGNQTELIRKCLKEIKNCWQQQESKSFGQLGNAAKREVVRKEHLFYFILDGLAGSSLKANYLIKTQVNNQKTGVQPEIELEYSELTPEKHDDQIVRQNIINLFAFGAENFGLGIWDIIGNHIYIRKIIGKELDYDFINRVLFSSSFSGMLSANGQYGLEGFKKEFIFCLTYRSLESNLETKPNFEKSKTKLLQIITKFIVEIREKLTKDSKRAGSEDMSTRMVLLGNIYKLLLESHLLTEEELVKFSSTNPIIPVIPNLRLKNLKRDQVYHTLGYASIPQEIKFAIKAAGFDGFCRQNSHLLSIYWVPRDKQAAFAGYATYDKNTIVITYDKIRPEQVKELGDILVHELRHKKDHEEFRQYAKQLPKLMERFTKPPLLITERNAYIYSLAYYQQSSKKLTKKEKQTVDTFKNRIYLSNLLLGLPGNSKETLQPPYNKADLQSPAIELQPGDILINQQQTRLLLKTLKKLGYSNQEKQWLLAACVHIFTKQLVDLTGFPFDRRNLLIDYISKLIGNKRSNSKGFNNGYILAIVMSKDKRDRSSLPVLSAYQLWRFIAYFCKKNKISPN